MFCDVILIATCTNQRFPAHRIILAASNDYFNALFSCEMLEQNQMEINIHDIDGDTLGALIEYCYSNEIVINDRNVNDIVHVSSVLQFLEVQDMCARFYENKLSIITYADIWEMSSKYNLVFTKKKTLKFILNQFLTIIDNEEFLHISSELLTELLQSDTMNNDSEMDVLQALVKWTQWNSNERIPFFKDLLKNIQCTVVEGKAFMTDIHFFEAIRNKILSDPLGNTIGFSRPPVGTIYALQFTSEKGILATFKYNHDESTWTKDELTYTPGYRNVQLILQNAVNRNVNIVGISSHVGRSCQNLSMNCQHQAIRSYFVAGRESLAMIYHEDAFYILGGYAIRRPNIRTVIKFNVNNRRFYHLPCMKMGRSRAACAILSNRLYLIGGESDEIKFLNHVEYYDLIQKCWVTETPMISKRSACQAGVANGLLFVFGGCDDLTIHTSIEMFDPTQETWTMMKFSMQVARCRFSITIVQNWVYIIGGFDNNSCYAERINLKRGNGELLGAIPHNFLEISMHLIYLPNSE